MPTPLRPHVAAATPGLPDMPTMELPQFPIVPVDAPTAVVTGGGRGIGRACAFRLAQGGYRVAVLARSLTEVDEVAGIIHAGGGTALSAVCDVTDPDSVDRALEAVTRRLGPVDVLVNNAGQARSVPFHRMTLKDFRAMVDVNLTGTFICTQAVLPAMLERKAGRIINVASTAGITGFRYVAHYVAAKHGVVGLTRALALEVAPKGITVNAVCPGWVDTDLLADTVNNIAQKTGKDVEAARASLMEGIPTRRFVTPEAVADLVAFLVSASAAHVTGAVLTMDGGETAGRG